MPITTTQQAFSAEVHQLGCVKMARQTTSSVIWIQVQQNVLMEAEKASSDALCDSYFHQGQKKQAEKISSTATPQRHLAEDKTDSSMLITVHFACTCVWAENPFY